MATGQTRNAREAPGLSGDLTQCVGRELLVWEKGLGLPRPSQPFSTGRI